MSRRSAGIASSAGSTAPGAKSEEDSNGSPSLAQSAWQLDTRNIQQHVTALLDSGLYSDVTFPVGRPGAHRAGTASGRLQRVPAHKLILAIRSPVFERLL